MRLFVGVSPDGQDAESQAVLEWTVRKWSSVPIDIVWMTVSRDPNSFWYSEPEKGAGWQTQLWSTPFSGFRWAIPEFCGFEGRAMYCDSDFIFMADVAELWRQPMKGKVVIAKGGDNGWRFCSCLWDCAAAKGHVLPLAALKKADGHRRMIAHFSGNRDLVEPFIGNWNCVDVEGYEDVLDPEIKAHHYSSMNHQLHVKHALPRLTAEGRRHWFDGVVTPHWREDYQKLFDDLLVEATENGYGIERYTAVEPYGKQIKLTQADYRHAHEWVK